jgi:sigma-B regulation protein RsbU (phosphoserine phosphatase)
MQRWFRRRAVGDGFWTRHVSRKARILFFAGVLVLWSVQALLVELAASQTAPWSRILVWALVSGVSGAAWAWCFTHDLRALVLVAPASALVPAFLGQTYWGRVPDPHRLYVALACLAATIGAYVFFIRFIATEGASSLRLRTEINLARDIHATLVPPIATTTRRVDLRGVSQPTTEVGGDLLDAVAGDDADTVFMADVSGHGVPAGVLMAMIRSAIRVRLRAGVPLAELVRDVNAVVFEATAPHMFATFAAMRFAAGGSEYAIAGHLPILWYRAQRRAVERLENEHPPLGILASHAFTSRQVVAAPDDLFVLFTDGMTEVRDRAGLEFGEERLVDLVRTHAHRPLADIEAALFAAVRAFGRQDDDQTLLVVRAGARRA